MKILNITKIILITLLFFFIFDFIFGKFIYKKLIRKNFIDTYQQIYLKTNYDHDLKKNLNVFYGNITYKLCTDKNGFRTFCDNVSNSNKIYDIALIGDSFTEGVGLKYENTFAGILTKKIGIERVANLGVSSFSPSIYFLKLNELINQGYTFKEVIVFVDQSDLVDELLCYKFTGDKIVRRKSFNKCINAGVINADEKLKGFFENYLRLSLEIFILSKNFLIKKDILEKKPTSLQINSPRSKWTYQYDKNIYNNFELQEAQKLLINRMDLVHSLLKENNIEMSLAVYPWPGTLYYDKADNIYFKMWEEFCYKKCKHFFDFNKIFFNKLKKLGTNKVITKYYIEGDFHFNKEGSEIIAGEFLKQYKKINNK